MGGFLCPISPVLTKAGTGCDGGMAAGREQERRAEHRRADRLVVVMLDSDHWTLVIDDDDAWVNVAAAGRVFPSRPDNLCCWSFLSTALFASQVHVPAICV